MQVTGMLHGAKLLQFVGYPTAEVLGPDASEEEIKALIDRYGSIFVKPIFKGGVGKKGKAGLIGRASDLNTALKEKERLYFVEHRHGNQVAKANGVTFEGAVPAEHEVYFSITESTRFRAPTMTLTHHGGVDIEELDKSQVAQVPFEAMATACALRYADYKAAKKSAGSLDLQKIPGVNHPVFKDKPVNHDPREKYVRELLAERGEYNIFQEYYHALVEALYEQGVSRNVYCVNIDAIIAALLLKMMWVPCREGKLSESAMETAAFTLFLYGLELPVCGVMPSVSASYTLILY